MLVLPCSQPLTGSSLERLDPSLVMGRPEILDLAGPTVRGVHDLDGGRSRSRLDVRTYATTADYEPSKASCIH